MDEKYLQNLYEWIKSNDSSYEERYSYDQFKQKIQDENYASQMHKWISSVDNTFEERRPLDAFMKLVKQPASTQQPTAQEQQPVKKKEPTGSSWWSVPGISESEPTETEIDYKDAFRAYSNKLLKPETKPLSKEEEPYNPNAFLEEYTTSQSPVVYNEPKAPLAYREGSYPDLKNKIAEIDSKMQTANTYDKTKLQFEKTLLQSKIKEIESSPVREYSDKSVEDMVLGKPVDITAPKFIEETLDALTPKSLSQITNTDAKNLLNYYLNDIGFKSEESIRNYVNITSPNGKIYTYYTLDRSPKSLNELKNFIRENTYDNAEIAKKDYLYEKENKKFRSKEEIESEVKKINDQEEIFNNEYKDFKRLQKGITDIKADLKKWEDFGEQNTPKYIQTSAYLKELEQELQGYAVSLQEKEGLLRDQDAQLKTSAGKYLQLQSEKGTFAGALYRGFMDSAANIFSQYTRMAFSKTIDFLPASSVYSEEQFDNAYRKKLLEEGIIKRLDEPLTGVMDAKRQKEISDEVDAALRDEYKKAGITGYYKGDKLENVLTINSVREGLSDFLNLPTTTTKEYKERLEKEGGIVTRGLLGLSGSIPAMIGPSWLRMANMYTMTTDAVMREMDNNPEFANISENEKELVAAPIGIVGAALEEIGFRGLVKGKSVTTNIVRAVLGRVPPGATASQIRRTTFDVVAEMGIRGTTALVGATLSEAETGAAQQVSEYYIKDIYNDMKGKKMFDTPEMSYKLDSQYMKDVLDAAATEAVGGFVMGVPYSIGAAFERDGFQGLDDATFKIFEELAKDNTSRKFFVIDLKNKINSGQITGAQGKKIIDAYDQASGRIGSVPDEITDVNDRKIAMDLITERKRLEDKKNKTDPALSKPIQDKIDNINEQLNTLTQDAISKQAASEVSLQPETGASQEMEAGGPEAGPQAAPQQGVLSPEETQRKEELTTALQNVVEGTVTIGEQLLEKEAAQAELDALLQKEQATPEAPKQTTTDIFTAAPTETKQAITFTSPEGTEVALEGNEQMAAQLYDEAIATPEEQRSQQQNKIVEKMQPLVTAAAPAVEVTPVAETAITTEAAPVQPAEQQFTEQDRARKQELTDALAKADKRRKNITVGDTVMPKADVKAELDALNQKELSSQQPAVEAAPVAPVETAPVQTLTPEQEADKLEQMMLAKMGTPKVEAAPVTEAPVTETPTEQAPTTEVAPVTETPVTEPAPKAKSKAAKVLNFVISGIGGIGRGGFRVWKSQNYNVEEGGNKAQDNRSKQEVSELTNPTDKTRLIGRYYSVDQGDKVTYYANTNEVAFDNKFNRLTDAVNRGASVQVSVTVNKSDNVNETDIQKALLEKLTQVVEVSVDKNTFKANSKADFSGISLNEITAPVTEVAPTTKGKVETENEKTAKRIRGKKMKGTLSTLDFGITQTIYNGALEFMARQVEKGTKLGNAIANTMKWIDDRMGGKKWDKGAFGKYMNDTYKVTLGDGRQVDVLRDDSKETADVINGWYSEIEQRMLDAKEESLPANKWAEKLRSKEDEDLWTGVRDFLQSKGNETVSKKEIKDFIKNNRVEIVEVIKGEGFLVRDIKSDKDIKEFDDYEDAVDFVLEEKKKGNDYTVLEKDKGKSVKFEEYQLEGDKENYKEVLVTLPVKSEKQKDTFKSSHFDEPNILVHLRMNTRTDADGNKVLFLEEVQSDWGQEGKKKGFKISAAQQKARNYYPTDGIPQAPFVMDTNAWVKLGLKVALREAVAQNATKIAWTNGEQQNKRYSLEKVADEVRYSKNPDGTYRVIAYKKGENVSENRRLQEDKLEDTLGKDIAQRIIDGVGEEIEGEKSLTGEYLSVGGTGMKGFYGSKADGSLGIVGNVAKSLFKQDPAPVNINGNNQQSIDVTPELKQSVQKGLPLFSNINLSDAVRSLKIKGPGGLQSNILGVPIAIWNAAMDTVAKAIDAGVALSGAVQKGYNYIKDKHKAINKERYEAKVLNTIYSDAIEMAREGNISDAGIKTYLTRQGLTESQADALLKIKPKAEKKPISKEKIVGKPKPKKVTVNEMAALKDQIRLEARAAREAKGDLNTKRKMLAAAIKDMVKKGKITTRQAAVLINKVNNTNLDNPVMVERLLEYADKVFSNAEYAEKIARANKSLKKAKENVRTKIGVSEGLTTLMNKLFNINPNLIPDDVLEAYLELVDMMGKRQAVLTLKESAELTKDVEKILNSINDELSTLDALIDIFESYDNKVLDENGKIDFAATIDKMLEKGVITASDAKIYKKYKDKVLPAETKEKKTEAQIAEEKKDLIDAIQQTKVDENALLMREERDAARSLFEAMTPSNLQSLTNAELKNLLKLLDNIKNGFLPHYAVVMTQKLNAASRSKTLNGAVTKAGKLPFTKLIANIKALFPGAKPANAIMVIESPKYVIDQVFGYFKETPIYNSVFKPLTEAFATYKNDAKKAKEKLDKAFNKVANSYLKNPVKIKMSQFKMMTYALQLEYESNKDKGGFFYSAADYIRETIKHARGNESTMSKKDIQLLEKILQVYGIKDADGKVVDIDIDLLYNSLNNAEKDAIKTIQEVNLSIRDKAMFTSAVIRGDKMTPIDNYIHHNVLPSGVSDKEISSVSDDMNKKMKPSTRAKTLEERTEGAKPLDFNIFGVTQRTVNETLMDFHLTEAVRTSRMVLNNVRKELQEKGNAKDISILDAIESSFEKVLQNTLMNTFNESTFADKTISMITKQSYRVLLASAKRWTAELISNLAYVGITNPKAYLNGITKYSKYVMSEKGPAILRNIKSGAQDRVYEDSVLSGRMIDDSMMNEGIGLSGTTSNYSIVNAMQVIHNNTTKRVQNFVATIADTLISTPDKASLRPFYFGVFAQNFKKETGQEVDFDKIADNDEAYLKKFKEAIEKSKEVADNQTMLAGGTKNPFAARQKAMSVKGASAFTQIYQSFNNFMNSFIINEYIAARTGLYAMMGNGRVNQKQGAAILAGVIARTTLYTLLVKEIGRGLMWLILGDDDEEDEEKSIIEKTGQAFAGSMTSLILGRDFGNLTRNMINYGVEKVNENYVQKMIDGKYTKDDVIAFNSLIPSSLGSRPQFSDLLINMSGAGQPFLRSAKTLYETAFAEEAKGEDTIKKRENYWKYTLPLEIAGYLGFVPIYKDVKAVTGEVLKREVDAIKGEEIVRTIDKEKAYANYETLEEFQLADPEKYDEYSREGGLLDLYRKQEKEIRDKRSDKKESELDAKYKRLPFKENSMREDALGGYPTIEKLKENDPYLYDELSSEGGALYELREQNKRLEELKENALGGYDSEEEFRSLNPKKYEDYSSPGGLLYKYKKIKKLLKSDDKSEKMSEAEYKRKFPKEYRENFGPGSDYQLGKNDRNIKKREKQREKMKEARSLGY